MANLLKPEQRDKIRRTFLNMEYGKNWKRTEIATQWLASDFPEIHSKLNARIQTAEQFSIRNLISTDNRAILATVCVSNQAIVESLNTNLPLNCPMWDNAKPFERTKVLHKMASSIQANTDLFVELDIMARGILFKNTMQCVPLLAEYFSYYSTFTGIPFTSSPHMCVVAKIFDDCSITTFGMIMAPVIASSRKLLLIVEPKISLIAALMLDLALKAGLPEDVVTIAVSHGTALDCLHAPRPQKISMIVFENADINSACDSLVHAAWGRHGTLFSSVDTILVQENIFETFVKKLKFKLNTVRMGLPHEMSVDIEYPADEGEVIASQLRNIKNAAQSLGLEVYKNDEYINEYSPLIVIGGKVATNKVIIPVEDGDDEHNADGAAPVVYVLAFRTINEGIALAGNRRQRLGVSVWTENVDIANRAAKKLKVNNVWINSQFLTAADIPLVQHRASIYFFGGKDGLYMNDFSRRLQWIPGRTHNTWSNMERQAKIEIFYQFVDKIIDNFSWLKAKYSERILNEWIWYINECMGNKISCGYSRTAQCTIYREPRGTVRMHFVENIDLKLLVTALLEGNCVMCFHRPQHKCLGLLEELNSLLPKNVLKLTSLSKTIRVDRSANGPDSTCSSIRQYVTVPKNVWNNIGQSI